MTNNKAKNNERHNEMIDDFLLNPESFLHYNRPLVTQIDNDTIEKYTDRGTLFDYESYIKLQNQKEGKFLAKIKECNEITERGKHPKHIIQFQLEKIKGDTLGEYYMKLDNNHSISLDYRIKRKLLCFYQILDWYRVLLTFSRENQPTCNDLGNRKNVSGRIAPSYLDRSNGPKYAIFCHEDIHESNIIVTDEDKLILIDPESFRWVEPSAFFIMIIKDLTLFLMNGLYSKGYDEL